MGTGRHAVWVVRVEDAERYAAEHLGKRGFASTGHPNHGQRPPRKAERVFSSPPDRTSESTQSGDAAADTADDDPATR